MNEKFYEIYPEENLIIIGEEDGKYPEIQTALYIDKADFDKMVYIVNTRFETDRLSKIMEDGKEALLKEAYRVCELYEADIEKRVLFLESIRGSIYNLKTEIEEEKNNV